MQATNSLQDDFEFRGQVLQTCQTILLGKLFESLQLFTKIHDTIQCCKKNTADLRDTLIRNRVAPPEDRGQLARKCRVESEGRPQRMKVDRRQLPFGILRL